MTTDNPTDDPIVVLHRYYLQATMLRRLFEQMMKQYPGQHTTSISEGFLRRLTSMNLWYAAVYAVAEGWRENLKLSDPKVDPLINDPKIYKLKQYRNAVFHYQREYVSPKMLNAMKDPDFAQWVTQLYEELGRYFLEYIDKWKSKPTS